MEFLKRYWLFLLLIIAIFAIQIYFYCSTFSTENGFSLFFWKNFEQEVNGQPDIEGKWGAFGDYMGGVLNPILGFITIVLLLISHYKDSQKDHEYHKQRQIDLLLIRIHKLMEMHNNNINGFSIDDGDNNPKIQGKFVFSVIYNVITVLCKQLEYLKKKGLIEKEILIICFIIVYYGRGESLEKVLKINFPILNYERDIKHILDDCDKSFITNNNLHLLNGFSTTLGVYFRGLFHLVDTIHTSDLLNNELKYELIKDVRSQMSNQEQALLLINTMTKLGNKWIADGLILNYKLARNIDRSHDFNGYKLEDYIFNIIEQKNPLLLNPQKYKIYGKYFEG